MKATVAICTYNRAYDLSESIHSAIRQHVEYKVEIIVIDNNSTDHTAQLVQEIQASEGVNNVKYILEKKPGLSAARNRAIREARGEYILFLDDDAIASPLWIQHIVGVFESDSSIGCVGGKIEPLWESQKPEWIPSENLSLYTILDYADHVVEMPNPSIPFGANVAFRTRLFQDIAPFREDLGRVGKNLLSNEESELIARIRVQHKVFYTPFGSVQHKVSKERTTKNWFLRRVFWQGVSDAVRKKDKGVVRTIKHAIRLGQGVIRALLCIYSPKRFTRQLAQICYRNGLIIGILRYNSKE
ncbi:glycosyltransferase [Paenibacillus xylanexedens]|uniref:glycosyltransferase n=1 Tax=Paenibacillus xylanexedens TaxID=528191 RepID=UPI003D02DC9C